MDILKKLNNSEEVTVDELATVVKLIDAFSRVSLHPAIVGPVVAEIAKSFNQHHHTKTCRKYQIVCRFKFPKLTSYYTLIATLLIRTAQKKIKSTWKKSTEL